MMLLKEFVSSDEWQKMREAIWEHLQQAIKDCIEARSMEAKEYYRGVADTLAEVIDLPKLIIPSEPDGAPLDKLPEPDLAAMFVANRKSLDQLY
jgi:hypothetical protein